MPVRKLPCAVSLLLAAGGPAARGSGAAARENPGLLHLRSRRRRPHVRLAVRSGRRTGREAPGFDDSRWPAVKPGLAAGELPPGGWPGVGWFRRHLLVEPALQGRTVALRFAAPGAADVYLDGRLVLTAGQGGAPPEMPWERREASLVRLEGHEHLLAVRYVYSGDSRHRAEGIGFLIILADPALARATVAERPWMAGIQGAIVAIPLFLAFLHFAFFGFDPRARGNLFYALEMAACAVILLYGFRGSLFSTENQRDFLEQVGPGMPIVAILFGILTYYAFLKDPFPRTWRPLSARASCSSPSRTSRRRRPHTAGSSISSRSPSRSSGWSGDGG